MKIAAACSPARPFRDRLFVATRHQQRSSFFCSSDCRLYFFLSFATVSLLKAIVQLEVIVFERLEHLFTMEMLLTEAGDDQSDI